VSEFVREGGGAPETREVAGTNALLRLHLHTIKINFYN